MLAKRGFREEGYAERYLRIGGTWEDHVIYGLTAEEWRPSLAEYGEPAYVGQLMTGSGR